MRYIRAVRGRVMPCMVCGGEVIFDTLADTVTCKCGVYLTDIRKVPRKLLRRIREPMNPELNKVHRLSVNAHEFE